MVTLAGLEDATDANRLERVQEECFLLVLMA